MSRGYFAVGLTRPKTDYNIASVIRAAACFQAAAVVLEAERANYRTPMDPTIGWKKLPVFRTNDMTTHIPAGAVPVAVDLVDGAVPLPSFEHPELAFYVFGPEDGTLGERHLSFCPKRVMIPCRPKTCLNLAAAVDIVLYDRMVKRGL